MELTATQIKKYSKYSIPQLRKKAGDIFRKWIRERDKEKRCISCSTGLPEQAGHFYSAGHYPVLEFSEHNVNGQCLQCNYHKHGNLLEYRKNLVKKIGLENVETLDRTVAISKHDGYHHDRFRLIEIIEEYKHLKK